LNKLSPVVEKGLKEEAYENEPKNARGVLRGNRGVREGCGRGKGRENCSRVTREEQNRLF